jgi:hypothetical protein
MAWFDDWLRDHPPPDGLTASLDGADADGPFRSAAHAIVLAHGPFTAPPPAPAPPAERARRGPDVGGTAGFLVSVLLFSPVVMLAELFASKAISRYAAAHESSRKPPPGDPDWILRVEHDHLRVQHPRKPLAMPLAAISDLDRVGGAVTQLRVLTRGRSRRARVIWRGPREHADWIEALVRAGIDVTR